ncbi:hypothetical protein D3C87_162180 [compost metagenome]
MENAFSKLTLEASLARKLESLKETEAAWFGGSRATGTEDRLSDTDLVVISAQPEVVFEKIENLLKENFTIEKSWTVETSLWKCSQKFYILKETPETYFVDISVFSSLDPQDYREFFNVERHGRAEILFDRRGILREAAQAPRYEKPLPVTDASTLGRIEVLYRTFLKEAQREKYIDSMAFFQRLLAVWIQTLRRAYAPQKHDFGLRYATLDLPPTESEKIEKYLKVHDLETMKSYAQEIRNSILTISQEN